MKKWIALLCAVILYGSLTACGLFKLSEQQQLVVDTVNRYLEEGGNVYVEAYKREIDPDAAPLRVVHAMDYRLENWEMYESVHCLMICLDGGMLIEEENAIYNGMTILLDMDTGKIYDTTIPIQANGERPIYDTVETLMPLLCHSYHSWCMFQDSTEPVMTSASIAQEFAEKDIKAINRALGK